MTPSVFIVGGSLGYIDMFKIMGWNVVDKVIHADMVQFTGGEDVNPALYGEPPHPRTHFNPERDRKEALFFNMCVTQGTPMAGICRGGQFLNVMNGGKMWQHVTEHSVNGTHDCVDIRKGESFQVTSTHHQMMIPSPKAQIIGAAFLCRRRERMRKSYKNPLVVLGPYAKQGDIEILWYPETKSFCFQPHPEMLGYNALRTRYFNYLEEFFDLKKD